MKINIKQFNDFTGKAGPIDLFKSLDIDTYCEIGVREGNTFQSRSPLVNNYSLAVDCWDLYETPSQNDMGRERNQAEQQYLNLLNKYKDNDKVDIVRSFSNNEKLYSQIPKNYFDLIFIDGDHSYKGVKEDLNNWFEKSNTIFCGHDYMTQHTVWNGVTCGVKQAVDEFVEEQKDNIKEFRVYLDSPNPTWFIWKK